MSKMQDVAAAAMDEKDFINVVFASDSNYAQHAAVAMTSILANTKAPERVAFYLLDDNVADEVKRKMVQTVEQFGSVIHFVAVDAERFNDFYVSAQLSRAAYFRLEMAKLLPETVHKAVYMDCDLLVLDDIQQLWDVNLDGKPLAAVPDFGIMASHKDWKEKKAHLDMRDGDLYFNSGMLVLDLILWREYDYGQQVEDVAASHNFRHHDQDALNFVFHNNWVDLPIRWNVIPPVWQLFTKILRNKTMRERSIEARKNMAVLHYAGGYKPWEYKREKDFNARYYDYLEQTAFKDAEMPQMDPRKKRRSLSRQLQRIKLANFWGKCFG